MPQAWKDALNTAVQAGKIPNVPISSGPNNGIPVYSPGSRAKFGTLLKVSLVSALTMDRYLPRCERAHVTDFDHYRNPNHVLTYSSLPSPRTGCITSFKRIT
ncbi:hypothetical protein BJV78DRAFT_1182855 [Lactifluus subvellereus]|nr:hypothetical protein BJV78DRAFT_1182855 [Lactifluus subvellereus]